MDTFLKEFSKKNDQTIWEIRFVTPSLLPKMSQIKGMKKLGFKNNPLPPEAEPNQFKIVEIIWAHLDDRLPRLADVGFAVRKGLLENVVLPLSVVVGVVVLYEWY